MHMSKNRGTFSRLPEHHWVGLFTDGLSFSLDNVFQLVVSVACTLDLKSRTYTQFYIWCVIQ